MKQLRKLLCTFLVMVMLVSLVNVPFFYATESRVQAATVVGGRFSQYLAWSLDLDTGEFKLSGFNHSPSFTDPKNAPWYKFKDKIKVIYIDFGVNYLGDYLFGGVENVEEIHIPCTAECTPTAFCNLKRVGTIHIEKGKDYDMIQQSNHAYTPWGKKSVDHVIVENGVQSIPSNAFAKCSGIKKITLCDSVERVGGYAFQECTSLKEMSVPCSINMGGGLSSLGMFTNTPVFEKVTITKGKGYMDNYSSSPGSGPTFCGSLPWARAKYVSIESGVKGIGQNAFYYANCKNIILPESVKEIGNNAFNNQVLENIAILNSDCFIPDSETTIRSTAKIYYTNADGNAYAYGNKYHRTMQEVILMDGKSSYTLDISKKQFLFFTNKSNGNYNAYTIKDNGAKDICLKGYLYDGGCELISAMSNSRGEYNSIDYLDIESTYMYCIEPVNYAEVQADVTDPLCQFYFQLGVGHISYGTITSENKLTDRQVVTLDMADSDGVAGYYWGTSKDVEKNTFYEIEDSAQANTLKAKETATTDGTYYLSVLDGTGKVTTVAEKEFCKTTLELNKGSYNQISLDLDYIITEKGKTITLPALSCSHCENTAGQTEVVERKFNGWSRRDTYNWKSTTDLPDTETFTVNENTTFYAYWNLGVDDIRFSFLNTQLGLDYVGSIKLSVSSYGLIYGYSSVYNLLTKVETWKGDCYGMSTTAGMFLSKTADLWVSDFDSTAKNALGLKIHSKGTRYPYDLKTVIEANQISYMLSTQHTIDTFSFNSRNSDISTLLAEIAKVKETGNAVVINFWGDGESGHAVLAYDYKKVNNQKTIIYVYDPNVNHPEYLTINTNNTKMTGWSYCMNNDKWWGTQYNTTDSKNYIEYETLDAYSKPWTQRYQNEDQYYSLLLIDSQHIKVKDAQGNTVYLLNGHVIQKSESVVDLETYIDEEVTLLKVPVGQYTITNLDSNMASFSVDAANSENGVSVTTSADTVTVNVSAEDGVNAATVDTAKGDTYDIEMTYIDNDTENRLSINGTAAKSEDVVMDYSDNNLSVEGANQFNVKVNGNKYQKVQRKHMKKHFRFDKDLSKQRIVNR